MPWTEKQVRLFQAAAHNPKVAKQVGIPQEKAKEMAAEGTKKAALVKELRKPNK